MTFVCLYTGPADTCTECGGFDPTGTGFCEHECRESFEAHGERMKAEQQARRDADDAFGRAADELRALGHTDEEIDELLRGMP